MSLKDNRARELVEALVAKEGARGPNRRLIARARRRLRRGAVSTQLIEELSAALSARPFERRPRKGVLQAAPETIRFLIALAATSITWLLPPTVVLVGLGTAAVFLMGPGLRPFTVAVALGALGLFLAIRNRTPST